MIDNSNFPWTPGTPLVGQNVNTTTSLVAGVSGQKLSLKSLEISCTAACTITIEEETSGTDLFTYILPANGGVSLEWDPREMMLTSPTAGKGIFIKSSTTDIVSARASAWMHS